MYFIRTVIHELLLDIHTYIAMCSTPCNNFKSDTPFCISQGRSLSNGLKQNRERTEGYSFSGTIPSCWLKGK